MSIVQYIGEAHTANIVCQQLIGEISSTIASELASHPLSGGVGVDDDDDDKLQAPCGSMICCAAPAPAPAPALAFPADRSFPVGLFGLRPNPNDGAKLVQRKQPDGKQVQAHAPTKTAATYGTKYSQEPIEAILRLFRWYSGDDTGRDGDGYAIEADDDDTLAQVTRYGLVTSLRRVEHSATLLQAQCQEPSLLEQRLAKYASAVPHPEQTAAASSLHGQQVTGAGTGIAGEDVASGGQTAAPATDRVRFLSRALDIVLLHRISAPVCHCGVVALRPDKESSAMLYENHGELESVARMLDMQMRTVLATLQFEAFMLHGSCGSAEADWDFLSARYTMWAETAVFGLIAPAFVVRERVQSRHVPSRAPVFVIGLRRIPTPADSATGSNRNRDIDIMVAFSETGWSHALVSYWVSDRFSAEIRHDQRASVRANNIMGLWIGSFSSAVVDATGLYGHHVPLTRLIDATRNRQIHGLERADLVENNVMLHGECPSLPSCPGLVRRTRALQVPGCCAPSVDNLPAQTRCLCDILFVKDIDATVCGCLRPLSARSVSASSQAQGQAGPGPLGERGCRQASDPHQDSLQADDHGAGRLVSIGTSAAEPGSADLLEDWVAIGEPPPVEALLLKPQATGTSLPRDEDVYANRCWNGDDGAHRGEIMRYMRLGVPSARSRVVSVLFQRHATAGDMQWMGRMGWLAQCESRERCPELRAHIVIHPLRNIVVSGMFTARAIAVAREACTLRKNPGGYSATSNGLRADMRTYCDCAGTLRNMAMPERAGHPAVIDAILAALLLMDESPMFITVIASAGPHALGPAHALLAYGRGLHVTILEGAVFWLRNPPPFGAQHSPHMAIYGISAFCITILDRIAQSIPPPVIHLVIPGAKGSRSGSAAVGLGLGQKLQQPNGKPSPDAAGESQPARWNCAQLTNIIQIIDAIATMGIAANDTSMAPQHMAQTSVFFGIFGTMAHKISHIVSLLIVSPEYVKHAEEIVERIKRVVKMHASNALVTHFKSTLISDLTHLADAADFRIK